jgi:hypothetical protein
MLARLAYGEGKGRVDTQTHRHRDTHTQTHRDTHRHTPQALPQRHLALELQLVRQHEGEVVLLQTGRLLQDQIHGGSLRW